MRLRIFSDLHFEFHADNGAQFVRSLHADPNEVLILAGDIAVGDGVSAAVALFCAKWRQVLFVAGNHEYYHHRPADLDAILTTCSRNHPNFHWLDNTTVTIDGQRFVGGSLWFDEDAGCNPARRYLNDFSTIEDFEPWVYRQHAKTVALLRRELQPTDVVITHHLPAQCCVHPKWQTSVLNPFFVHDLEQLIRQRQPKLWVHGHTHERVDERIEATRIVANPFGYKGLEEQVAFDHNFVVEVN
ncbi:MAG: hypothetical protein EXR77_12010 [Myxococcales bacterium]|nr:hypothetical protein [Myxococcales bacterium]